jgi:hypothetical protein
MLSQHPSNPDANISKLTFRKLVEGTYEVAKVDPDIVIARENGTTLLQHQDIICLYFNQRNELVNVHGLPRTKTGNRFNWIAEMLFLRNAND